MTHRIQNNTGRQPARSVSIAEVNVNESLSLNDPQWDQFLTVAGQGQFEQTSLWAQVKRFEGWTPLRLTFTVGGEILAGCQILMTTRFPVGIIGYVSKGPVIGVDDPAMREYVIAAMERSAKKHRIRFLVIQPPDLAVELGSYLSGSEYCRNHIISGENLTGAVVIDLRKDIQGIFSAMKRQKRQNVRKGQEMGVRVVEGTRDDLPTFHDYMIKTCKRQGSPPRPAIVDQFERMWDMFAPQEFIRLFWAVCEGNKVSGMLAIPFGTRVTLHKFGWSGNFEKYRPNDVLYWETIKWSRENGYKKAFITGMSSSVARAVSRKKSRPDSIHDTPLFFKLGFGGEICLFPEIRVFIPGRFPRAGYKLAFWTIGALNAYILHRDES